MQTSQCILVAFLQCIAFFTLKLIDKSIIFISSFFILFCLSLILLQLRTVAMLSATGIHYLLNILSFVSRFFVLFFHKNPLSPDKSPRIILFKATVKAWRICYRYNDFHPSLS